MAFEVRTVYEKADAAAWINASAHLTRPGRAALKGSRILLRVCAVPVALIGALFLMSLFTAGPSLMSAAVAAGCFLLAWWLVKGPAPAKWAVRDAWNAYERKGETIRFRFDEEGFEIFSAGQTASYRYAALTQVFEDDRRYFLCVGGPAISHMLHKAGFTAGKPEEFGRFLYEKTGKSIKFIK